MPVPKSVVLEYLRQGLSVFPLYFTREHEQKADGTTVVKYQKKPRVKWGVYQARLATPEEVEAWYALTEPAGIGLATGELSKVVVVDVDDVQSPIPLSSSVVSKSGFRNGKHYFYRWTEEVRNKVKIKDLPLDFRGDGGFVVLPPSSYEGHAYEFEVCDFTQLQPLPRDIVTLLTEDDSRIQRPSIQTGSQTDPYPEAFEGGRNDTAARVAGSIIRGMEPAMWAYAGWLALQDWNLRKCHPSLPEDELRRTFNSIIEAETRAIVKQETGEVVAVPKPMSMRQTGELRVEEKKLEAIAPTTGYPELDMYIRGFVPGHLLIFTGQTNIGKTTICANFAHHVVQQQKRVLYIALEPENSLVDYLASIRTGKRFDQLTEQDLLYDDPNLHIYGKSNIAAVEDLIKVIEALPRYDLVIIDHIGYFTVTSGDARQKESNVLKMLVGIAKEKRCAILAVAHPRKTKNPQTTLSEDDISGSAAFKQDATEVLIAVRETSVDEKGNPRYTDKGSILVRKTKAGGGEGSVDIVFVPGTAQVLDPSSLFYTQIT